MNHGVTQSACIAGAPAHAVARAVTRTGPGEKNRARRYVVVRLTLTSAASAPIGPEVRTSVRSEVRHTPKRTESMSTGALRTVFALAALAAVAGARARS